MYDELIVKFSIILCVGIVVAGFIDTIVKDIKEKRKNKQKGKRTDGS